MSVFKNSKPQPKGKMGAPKGGWPDITKVPGDGDVVKPNVPGGMPAGSAAHAADDTENLFGVGRAKQRGSEKSRMGKITE
jgi:hypothetical protein